MSLRLHALNLALRLTAKPFLRHVNDVQRARRVTDWVASRSYRISPNIRYRDYSIQFETAEVPVRRFSTARSNRSQVLLYFHGGGYFSGSLKSHSGIAARLAELTDSDVILPAYRLSPEHPFPAAPTDALACYRSLLKQGISAKNIALCGESAGGGLALSTLHSISSLGLDQPACTCVFSPWTDLTLSGPSISQNALSDVLVPTSRLPETIAGYLCGAPANDPRASPLFGDFSGSGPILFHASRSEALFDDSSRLVQRIQATGCDVRLVSWSGTPHAWHLFFDFLPEAKTALECAAKFFRIHLPQF